VAVVGAVENAVVTEVVNGDVVSDVAVWDVAVVPRMGTPGPLKLT
jgi:hypothetical protein